MAVYFFLVTFITNAIIAVINEPNRNNESYVTIGIPPFRREK